jgi:dihydroorotase
VAAPGTLAPGPGWDVIDASGLIVTPGLMDLHGHWYLGSAYGIDVSANLRGGVTTTVDAGTVGFVTWASFRSQSIDTAPVRALAFLNVSALGILFPLVGEMEDRRFSRPRETAALIREDRDHLVGVKVRLSAASGDVDEAWGAAREAGDLAGVPVMVDVGSADDGMPGILGRMRPGDILTHCFTGGGRGILGPDGRVGPEARAARQRGVRFDVGHGAGSFSYAVARAAVAEGFLPDSISTDLHVYSVAGPVVDLPTTMAKFLHLGVPIPDVIALTTVGPARSVGIDSPGVALGAPADLAVLRVIEAPSDLRDGSGTSEVVDRTLAAEWTIVAGHAVRSQDVPVRVRPLTDVDRELLAPPPG